jgi:amino acid transporter
MDTNTVNYAINKLSEGFQAIAPTVQNISEKYVHFIVTQQIILFSISFMCVPLVVIFMFLGFKFKSKSKTLENEYRSDSHEVFSFISFVVAACLTIAGCISISITGYNALLAYTNPEMFTVQKIIDGARK